MPKFEVPDMKHRFTDHRIRVVERAAKKLEGQGRP
jgi:hypothetical protein